MKMKLTCAAITLASLAASLHGENLLKNGSFEGTRKYWMEGGVIDSSTAKDGIYSYRFDNPGKIRSGSFKILPNQEVTVSFWAKSEGKGNVSFSLSPSNRNVAQSVKAVWCKNPQWSGELKLTPEWQKFTKTFKIPDLGENGSFLGSNVAWWNKTSWIIQLHTKAEPTWLDAVSITVGDTSPDVYSGFKDVEVAVENLGHTRQNYQLTANIIEANTPVNLTVSAYNCTDEIQNVTLEMAVYDYTGTVQFNQAESKRVKLEPHKPFVYTGSVTPNGKGLMLARITAKNAEGEVISTSEEPLTVLAYPKNATTINTKERMGASFRSRHLIDAGQKIGLGWSRWYPQMNWGTIQPVDANTWEFEKIDATLDYMEAHGISATATLHKIPKWCAVPGSKLPSDMNWDAEDPRWDDLSIVTGWDTFLRTIVKRYKTRVVYELVNEPDLKNHWNRKVYTRFVERSYRIIKSVCPEANVQVNVTWPGVSGWTRGFIADGGHNFFDTYTFHNYTAGDLCPESANHDLHQTFMSFGATPKEVWFNEGWMHTPTSEDFPAPSLVDMSAPSAAHIQVRSVVKCFASGVEKFIPFHIGYGSNGKSWWDWVGSGSEWWDDFGQPTIAVATYNTIADHLGLSKFVKKFTTEEADIFLFDDQRHDRGVFVVWSEKGDATVKLSIDDLVKTDAVGNEFTVESGTLQLSKNKRPWFVYSKSGMSAKDMASALKQVHVDKSQLGNGVYRLPATFAGPKVGSREGNSINLGTAKVWEMMRVWPDDIMKIKNYHPLTWSGTVWNDPNNSHGGQPSIHIETHNAGLSGRTGAGKTRPGNKLPALVFHCLESGNYSISTEAAYKTWEGKGPYELVILKATQGDRIIEVSRHTWEGKRGSELLELPQVELEKGDRLIFTMNFKGGASTNIVLKELTIRLQ